MNIYTKEMITKKNEKIRRRKLLFKIILTPIVISILLICVYTAYQKFILKKQDIEFLGYKMYIVLTGSMEPTIKPNDLIVIKAVDKESINEGDIITFTAKGKVATVTHRVVEVVEKDGNTYYKTKGDNNNTEDEELIDYDKIQGKYLFKISKVGVIITKSLTGTGLIVVFLILVLSYHYSSKKEDRRLTREEARKKYNICKYKRYEEDKKDGEE